MHSKDTRNQLYALKIALAEMYLRTELQIQTDKCDGLVMFLILIRFWEQIIF